jgi:hypothetical protein
MSESAIKYGIGAIDRRIENRKVLISECRHTDEVNRKVQLLAYSFHPNVAHNATAKAALKISVKEI